MGLALRSLLPMVALLALASGTARAQPIFDAPYRHFATSGAAYAVATGHFRGGALELVVSHPEEKTLEFLNQSANGDWLPVGLISIPNRPHGLAVADLDRDGIADVVAGGFDPPSVVVLRGLGHGDFAVSPAIILPTSSDGVLVTDFDADGWPDLVTWSNTGINLLRNDGAGGFPAPSPFTGGGEVAIGRVDTDAFPDLVLRGTGGLNLYPGLGDGSFGPVRLIAGGCAPRHPRLADLDGDGDLDFLAPNGCSDVVEDNSLLVFLNDGSGDFPVVRSTATIGSAEDIAVADIDGDHRPDAIVIAHDQEPVLNLMTLESGGVFQNLWARRMQSFSTPIAADISGDGCDDVIQADGTGISVLLGSPTRSFGRAALNVSGEGTFGLFATRIDDGPTIDFVVTRPSVDALTIGLSGPGGDFNLVYRSIDGAAQYFVVDDLDLDGHQDLVAADARIDIEHGVGNATFVHGQRLSIAGRVATAPLDNDLYPELWVARGDSLFALRNRGDGSFEPWRAWIGGGERILVRDVSADGSPDVVLVRGTRITVRRADGFEDLEGETEYEAGAASNDIEIADLNGDGPLDIVLAHYGNIPCNWFRGNGDGTFQAAQPLNLPATERIALADWDGDGRLDVASIVAGKVAISFNLGGHQFGPPLWFGAGHNPIDLATGDFDADGRPDIAVLKMNYMLHGETWGDIDVMFNRIAPGLVSDVGARTPTQTPGLAVQAPTPNPMRTFTRARFSIAGIQPIEARVLDLQGREVAALFHGSSTGGEQELVWNGRDSRDARVQPGIYFIAVRTGSQSGAHRIVVLE